MNCLECRTADAGGVCQGCGAAVCRDHARLAHRTVSHGVALGPRGEATLRSVLCPAWAEAGVPTAAVTGR
ncbi:hypothetical protein ACFU7T_20075 [Streptomyces sp. NPDC057555]|uniref:hypothetical protein n=1 Tax=Streptomyces sp. NPDC057555 TaxID=3346166 RepID=UPI00367BE7DA